MTDQEIMIDPRVHALHIVTACIHLERRSQYLLPKRQQFKCRAQRMRRKRTKQPEHEGFIVRGTKRIGGVNGEHLRLVPRYRGDARRADAGVANGWRDHAWIVCDDRRCVQARISLDHAQERLNRGEMSRCALFCETRRDGTYCRSVKDQSRRER